MATPSDPTPPRASADLTQAAIAQTWQQGLLLLKQRQYAAAIAPLTTVMHTAGASPLGWKAQMGLVKAYARLGQTDQALTLCAALVQTDQPDIQQWATQIQATLRHQRGSSVEDPAAASSSAAPGTEIAGEPRSPALAPDPTPDVTGFMPLTSSADLSPGAIAGSSPPPAAAAEGWAGDPTGFQALPRESAPQPVAASDVTEPTTGERRDRNRREDNLAPAGADGAEADGADEMPPTVAASSPLTLVPPDYELIWRNCDRAKRWQPLRRVWIGSYWVSFGVAVAFALVGLRTIFIGVCTTLNRLIFLIDWPINLQYMWWLQLDPLLPIVVYLIMVAAVCPWLWDWLMVWRYGARSLNLSTLKSHSDESVRVIQRHIRQHQWRSPRVYLLSTPAPVIFSYGYPRWFTRIVLSQGLLNQLEPDEVAVLVARELDQLQHGDGIWLAVITLAAQLPYQLYLTIAAWGDRQSNRLLRGLAKSVSALGYGLYSALRWTGLGLARHRVWHSDRAAVGMTGNPNGLIRAVLKLAQGTAQAIAREGQTAPLLESVDSLMPLGHRSSLTVGSLLNQVPLAQLLRWETQHPYRTWLAINNPHPPLGDRLYRLCRLAVQLHLEPELEAPPPSNVPKATSFFRWLDRWQALFFQGSPWTGAAVGASVAILLRWTGKLAREFGVYSLDWLGRETDLLTIGIVMGFGVGVWLRINALFPDLTPEMINPATSLVDIAVDPEALPIYPRQVELQGKLLGRSDGQNNLGQDLLLHTPQGLVKLHYTYLFGPFGNLIMQASSLRPEALLGRQVTVRGWLRRGVNPWLDLEQMSTQTQQIARANPPIGETLLGAIAIAVGIFLLLNVR